MTHPDEVEEVVKAIAVHVKTGLRTAKDEINKVNERVERRSKDIEDKIQHLENKILTGKTAKISGLENKVMSIPEELESRFDEKLNERLSEISSEVNQINQRISSFSAASDNSKEIDSLRSQVDQAKGSKQRLDSIENMVKSEIQRLEESMKKNAESS